ncbi:hypothetical protein BJ508DRAFT_326913 [Ascobolus immersus RN42]|uniref:Uncharacterized protein n=1 Tax=Ascobolus immersus RN42 TaxID=1160509 RepID=A0A3N4I846_ASCIM|nr:hypothetical protein BJ508DRAFT_326913 [Ascobolus immersus RN42]
MPCAEKNHRDQKHNLHGWTVPPAKNQEQFVWNCETICGYCLTRFSRRGDLLSHIRLPEGRSDYTPRTRCRKLREWGLEIHTIVILSPQDQRPQVVKQYSEAEIVSYNSPGYRIFFKHMVTALLAQQTNRRIVFASNRTVDHFRQQHEYIMFKRRAMMEAKNSKNSSAADRDTQAITLITWPETLMQQFGQQTQDSRKRKERRHEYELEYGSQVGYGSGPDSIAERSVGCSRKKHKQSPTVDKSRHEVFNVETMKMEPMEIESPRSSRKVTPAEPTKLEQSDDEYAAEPSRKLESRRVKRASRSSDTPNLQSYGAQNTTAQDTTRRTEGSSSSRAPLRSSKEESRMKSGYSEMAAFLELSQSLPAAERARFVKTAHTLSGEERSQFIETMHALCRAM